MYANYDNFLWHPNQTLKGQEFGDFVILTNICCWFHLHYRTIVNQCKTSIKSIACSIRPFVRFRYIKAVVSAHHYHTWIGSITELTNRINRSNHWIGQVIIQPLKIGHMNVRNDQFNPYNSTNTICCQLICSFWTIRLPNEKKNTR